MHMNIASREAQRKSVRPAGMSVAAYRQPGPAQDIGGIGVSAPEFRLQSQLSKPEWTRSIQNEFIPRKLAIFQYLSLVRWRWVMAFRATMAKSTPLFKRLLDLVLVTFASLGVAPICIITAIAIKLDSRGPIFFRQTRVGYKGKPFICYKFRSMAVDAEEKKAALMGHNEADGPVFKMQNDPRVTRVGRIIRKLSIDELPQLLNVFKGEMSLVGPRPSLPSEVDIYQIHQLQRLDAAPGLTGLQQVSGRSSLAWQEWIRLDLQYIREQSLWRDIGIILKTIPVVIFGRGAY